MFYNKNIQNGDKIKLILRKEFYKNAVTVWRKDVLKAKEVKFIEKHKNRSNVFIFQFVLDDSDVEFIITDDDVCAFFLESEDPKKYSRSIKDIIPREK